MIKILENVTEISSREDYDKAMSCLNTLIAEATEKGLLSSPDANNEHTREIGRIGRLCADFEDKKIAFSHITVGFTPVVQKKMLKHDVKKVYA